MTVRELIDKLMNIPGDAVVIVPRLDGVEHVTPTKVRYLKNPDDTSNPYGYVAVDAER